jgi:hypothetical protein
MTLQVNIAAPEDLGECCEGWRSNYPIIGGTFEGPGLRGRILPGGNDQYLQRRDGVGELDARYSLLTDEGERINIHNIGRLVLDEEGQRLSDAGVWPLAPERYQCSCSPIFQVAEGRLNGLRQHMFIGAVSYPADDQVHITCYRLAGYP